MIMKIHKMRCVRCGYTVNLARPSFAPAPVANCSQCLQKDAQLVSLIVVKSETGTDEHA